MLTVSAWYCFYVASVRTLVDAIALIPVLTLRTSRGQAVLVSRTLAPANLLRKNPGSVFGPGKNNASNGKTTLNMKQ